jgi:hypothetical protein
MAHVIVLDAYLIAAHSNAVPAGKSPDGLPGSYLPPQWHLLERLACVRLLY